MRYRFKSLFKNGLAARFSVALVFSCSTICAQPASPTADKLKAVFIYNFTRFVEWPSSAFANTNDPFVIAIVGRDPFEKYLEETINNEFVGTHPIVIKYYDRLEQVNNCHLLYINYNSPQLIKDAINYAKEKHVLTVSTSEEFIRHGGMIRIYMQESQLKLHINNKVAKASQLNISSKLLRLSRAD